MIDSIGSFFKYPFFVKFLLRFIQWIESCFYFLILSQILNFVISWEASSVEGIGEEWLSVLILIKLGKGELNFWCFWDFPLSTLVFLHLPFMTFSIFSLFYICLSHRNFSIISKAWNMIITVKFCWFFPSQQWLSVLIKLNSFNIFGVKCTITRFYHFQVTKRTCNVSINFLILSKTDWLIWLRSLGKCFSKSLFSITYIF